MKSFKVWDVFKNKDKIIEPVSMVFFIWERVWINAFRGCMFIKRNEKYERNDGFDVRTIKWVNHRVSDHIYTIWEIEDTIIDNYLFKV